MRSRRRQLNLQKIEIDLQTGAFDVYVRLREQDVTVPVNLSDFYSGAASRYQFVNLTCCAR